MWFINGTVGELARDLQITTTDTYFLLIFHILKRN